MKLRLFLLLLLPLCTTIVIAQPQSQSNDTVFPQRLSAQDLLYTCNASALTARGRERRRYCAGFISGIEELARLLGAGKEYGGYQGLCMPANTSSRHLAKVYTRYAEQNKPMLEKPAAEIVLRALASAFPCTDKSGN